MCLHLCVALPAKIVTKKGGNRRGRAEMEFWSKRKFEILDEAIPFKNLNSISIHYVLGIAIYTTDDTTAQCVSVRVILAKNAKRRRSYDCRFFYHFFCQISARLVLHSIGRAREKDEDKHDYQKANWPHFAIVYICNKLKFLFICSINNNIITAIYLYCRLTMHGVQLFHITLTQL